MTQLTAPLSRKSTNGRSVSRSAQRLLCVAWRGAYHQLLRPITPSARFVVEVDLSDVEQDLGYGRD